MRPFHIVCATLFAPFVTAALQAHELHVRIGEVMGQMAGDPRIQFVELAMEEAGQNTVTGHSLHFFDAAGNPTGDFTFPEDAVNGDAGGTILVATRTFADAAGAEPDFIMPAGLLPPFAGRVCLEEDDCLAYGEFTGDNETYGLPAAGFSSQGIKSLSLVQESDPRTNATDYALGAPTPKRNNGSELVLQIPPSGCVAEETFTDLSRWDELAPNAGLDLTNCGAPITADTGTMEVQDGKLILTPGFTDDLGLEDPVALASLSNETALRLAGQDYRVRFNFLAHHGVTNIGVLMRVRYRFDAAPGTIDPAEFSGVGVYFTFDGNEHGQNDPSDHIHPEMRGACIQELHDIGPDHVDYPGFEMASELLWTLILDVEGDEESGPVTIRAKVFPTSQSETAESFAEFVAGNGMGPDPGPDLDHAFLIAVLGSAPFEIQSFSICEIPLSQRRVRNLACALETDGSVHLTWENPPAVPSGGGIRVLIDGVETASLDESASEYTIPALPVGQSAFVVINGSGAPSSCVLGRPAASFHFLRGDANDDRLVDVSDAVFILDFLFSGNRHPACAETTDVDGDGGADISDPISLLNHLFLGGEEPAAPYPDCGHGKEMLGCEVQQCPH